MSAAEARTAVTDAEAAALFADLAGCKALVLAVSGGPDSTALLFLAARWRARLRNGPELFAVTVDHGLRPEARREAAAVKRLAASLGVAHRTMRWIGAKPTTGLQEAARKARYRLLTAAAAKAKARHVLTAHTLDDQAETVLFRLARGSGLAGLAAMARISPLPAFSSFVFGRNDRNEERVGEMVVVRPFLDIPKARLIATLEIAQIPFAEDASNRDPRFARVRLRAVMPALAAEGLTSARLAQVANRLRRANEAIEAAVDHLARALVPALASPDRRAGEPITLVASEWAKAPAELRLRLLGRLVAMTGEEGEVELGKLEECARVVVAHLHTRSPERFRRTLAGAAISLAGDRLTVARAPPRRRPRGVRRENPQGSPGG
ncbi:MAG: tRNA lysidine(34) synthetase TilS [Xanthobacteraceae bacterium]